MKACLVVGCVVASAAAGAQQVLWNQPWDGNEQGALSSHYANEEQYSTYCFDDVTANAPWLITGITLLGAGYGGFLGVHVRFSQNANFLVPGTIGADYLRVGIDADHGSFFFGDAANGGSPLNLILPEGHWYMSVWTESEGGSSAWHWHLSRPVTGDEAVAHNPLGGLIGVTSPTAIGALIGESPVDLNMKIRGLVVQEPSTWAVIFVSTVALACRRRKSSGKR